MAYAKSTFFPFSEKLFFTGPAVRASFYLVLSGREPQADPL